MQRLLKVLIRIEALGNFKKNERRNIQDAGASCKTHSEAKHSKKKWLKQSVIQK